MTLLQREINKSSTPTKELEKKIGRSNLLHKLRSRGAGEEEMGII